VRGRKQLHSSVHTGGRDDWGTPLDLFENLNKEFGFVLDAAASEENSLCDYYMDEETDALSIKWQYYEQYVWLNPPYSKCKEFLYKVVKESECGLYGCVVLVPARTDTVWWHEYVMPYASEVRFIRGRLKFQGAKDAAPFPSAIIVYSGLRDGDMEVYSCDKLGNII